jgi:hypothetical protein
LGPDLGGVPRQGDNEPDSAAAGKKSSVERAWGKKSLVERVSGKKDSGNEVSEEKASDRKAPDRKAPVALKDEIQGPLVILTVLAAIVAIVGGLAGNSFLALAGGLMSGAALLAVIILGLTTPK